MLAPLHVPAITDDDMLDNERIQPRGTSFLDFSQNSYLTLKDGKASEHLMPLYLLASPNGLYILCL